MSPSPALPRSPASVPPQPPPGAQIFDARDRITVLTPCYDFSLTEYYHTSLRHCMEAQAWFRQPDGSVQLMPIIAERLSLPNDSHIDRARNVLLNMAERANRRFVLFWDADVPAEPIHILRLYIHLQKGHPFVVGFYAMKVLKHTWVANVLAGAKIDPESALIELEHGATGFMALDLDQVLPKLRTHPKVLPYRCAPNTPWPGEKFWAYFTSGVHGAADTASGLQNWQSEDWMICEFWRELGGKIMGDTQIKLRHLGRLLFPPDPAEMFEATLDLLNRNHPAINREKLTAALATPPKAK